MGNKGGSLETVREMLCFCFPWLMVAVGKRKEKRQKKRKKEKRKLNPVPLADGMVSLDMA
jgi:hypothetical protein